MNVFSSVKELSNEINKRGYISDANLVVTIYLAYHLNKPLLLEGPAGVGKTEIANVIADILGSTDPIRLQCYEGIDDAKAIYEWNYKKQLLYIEANKNSQDWQNMQDDIYSEDFLSLRPILKSISSDQQSVLLIDEIDKSDEEFEPLLLEILSAFQVSIPEIGTIKAKKKPFVVLTSNNIRELTDALRRRCCYFYIDYPSLERELEIVHTRVSGVDDLLATQVVKFVQLLRNENLKKAPSISETIDWVQALVKLEAKNLNPKLVKHTLNLILKTKSDLDLVETKLSGFFDKMPKRAVKIDKDNIQVNKVKQIDSILNNDDNWNF
jgi:MoxR-like ATPase